MGFKVPEKYRDPRWSSLTDGNNGVFQIPGRTTRDNLKIIASDGLGWDHLSISKKYECPTWEEMCHVKLLFWDDPEDWAVQYHPPKSQYVNNHPNCLHLWRSQKEVMPFPKKYLV